MDKKKNPDLEEKESSSMEETPETSEEDQTFYSDIPREEKKGEGEEEQENK